MSGRLTKAELAASLHAAGHTPGEWAMGWDNTRDCRAVGVIATGKIVCLLSPRKKLNSQDEQNGRLICAAPDLLAACEADAAFHEHFDDCHVCGVGVDLTGTYYCSKGAQMRETANTLRTAAIRKARGGQQP